MRSLPLFLSPQYAEILENSKLKLRIQPSNVRPLENEKPPEADAAQMKFYSMYRSKWIVDKMEEQANRKRGKVLTKFGNSNDDNMS